MNQGSVQIYLPYGLYKTTSRQNFTITASHGANQQSGSLQKISVAVHPIGVATQQNTVNTAKINTLAGGIRNYSTQNNQQLIQIPEVIGLKSQSGLTTNTSTGLRNIEETGFPEKIDINKLDYHANPIKKHINGFTKLSNFN